MKIKFYTLIYILVGMSIHQLAYNLFPFLSNRYRARLMALMAQGDNEPSTLISNTSDTEDLYEYPHLFANNLKTESHWLFNNASFELSNSFLFSNVDKFDYTPRVHFLHLEWVLNSSSPIDEFLKAQAAYSKATFYWHPSPATQRYYVCLYLLVISKDNKQKLALAKVLKEHALYIAENCEINLHGNHLLDNYMALHTFSLLSNNELLQNKMESSITNFFLKSEYFQEKTPCYSSIMRKKTHLMNSIFPSCSLYGRLNTFFAKNPSVHINDSYMSKEMWGGEFLQDSYVPTYYYTSVSENIVSTFVLESFPSRGFQAHAHLSNFSVHLYTHNDDLIIGGFGTPKYSMSKIRNYSRSSRAYASLSQLFSKHWVSAFFASFRNVVFYTLNYTEKYDSTAHELKIENKNIQLTVGSAGINVRLVKPFTFSFWSDLPLNEFKNRFQGSPTLLESAVVKPSVRYDGFYNKKACYHYKLELQEGDNALTFN